MPDKLQRFLSRLAARWSGWGSALPLLVSLLPGHAFAVDEPAVWASSRVGVDNERIALSAQPAIVNLHVVGRQDDLIAAHEIFLVLDDIVGAGEPGVGFKVALLPDHAPIQQFSLFGLAAHGSPERRVMKLKEPDLFAHAGPDIRIEIIAAHPPAPDSHVTIGKISILIN